MACGTAALREEVVPHGRSCSRAAIRHDERSLCWTGEKWWLAFYPLAIPRGRRLFSCGAVTRKGIFWNVVFSFVAPSTLEAKIMPKIEWKWPWEKSPPKPVKPPKVGGTRAPDQVEAIDFQKPHDFHFRLHYDSQSSIQVFERCLLIGFTTPMSDDATSARFEEYAHNRWIVLQRPDGRRVYIPRDNLLYIEDAAEEHKR